MHIRTAQGSTTPKHTELTQAHKRDQHTNLVGKPWGWDSAPPMGGRPYPSTSEVTWTRPRREEWPCPGSRGRHASWRQRSAQCSAARQSWQRHTEKLASTRKHAAHSIAEQSKAVYHNNNGGQPHHLPQAPTPAQHPTPRVGATHTTRALHPRTATAARKPQASKAGRPQGLGLGPANGWAALSKHFGGYPNSAPTGGAALPG